VDNETLIALYHSMDKICRHEMMSAFTWQSQLKSVWMQGVLERELVVRGFTLEQ
jgi:predicted DNA-binding transcriptional regulator